jgi:thioredoxin reductase (NADPH)
MKVIAQHDCAIIGAGVAGLAAALYLARFRRQVTVLDAGSSRGSWIPEIHNYPGLTGFSGQEFLRNLRDQATRFGADIRQGTVTQIGKSKAGGFIVETTDGFIHSAHILVASGIEDVLPDIVNAEDVVRSATLRLCVTATEQSIERLPV